jgi:hypothetical protein
VAETLWPVVGIRGLRLAAIAFRRDLLSHVCRRRVAQERGGRLHVTDAGVGVVRAPGQVRRLQRFRFLHPLRFLRFGGLRAHIFETLHLGGRCCFLRQTVEFGLLLVR